MEIGNSAHPMVKKMKESCPSQKGLYFMKYLKQLYSHWFYTLQLFLLPVLWGSLINKTMLCYIWNYYGIVLWRIYKHRYTCIFVELASSVHEGVWASSYFVCYSHFPVHALNVDVELIKGIRQFVFPSPILVLILLNGHGTPWWKGNLACGMWT